jgi:hypothetical protein
MASLKIQRLAMDLPGWSEGEARRLSHEVGRRLAEAMNGVNESVRLDNVRIDLSPKQPRSVELVAEEVANEILSQTRRNL